MVLLALLLPGPSWGAVAAGSAFDFLFLDANARSAALGGAYASLARGADALPYNPAGLAFNDGSEAAFMDNEYLEGVSQQVAGLAFRPGWGLHLNRVSYGEITRTTLSQPDGMGSFSGGAWAASGGYGRRAAPWLGFGAGVKLIRETLDDVSAQGFAADFGVLALLRGTSFGAALQNLGRPVRFQRDAQALPWTLRIGASRELPVLGRKLLVAADAVKERGESPSAAFGAEFVAAGRMPIRAGFSTRGDAGSGLVFGAGWRFRGHAVDYAFVPMGELGNTHRFSFTFRWGASLVRAPLPAASAEDLLAPDERAAAFLLRAEAFLADGLGREARADFLAAQGLLGPEDPRQVQAVERLGLIAERAGMLEVAQRRYRRALELGKRLGVQDPFTREAGERLDRLIRASGQ